MGSNDRLWVCLVAPDTERQRGVRLPFATDNIDALVHHRDAEAVARWAGHRAQALPCVQTRIITLDRWVAFYPPSDCENEAFGCGRSEEASGRGHIGLLCPVVAGWIIFF